MADLKPCPFCGGEASARKTYKGTFAVSCNRLCVGQYGYDTEEEAVEAWNTRKPIEEMIAELEKDSRKYQEISDYHRLMTNNSHRAEVFESKAEGVRVAISIVRGKE